MHTHALGERLHYAHLTDPTTRPAHNSSGPAAPPPDMGGLGYDTDLLALATPDIRDLAAPSAPSALGEF